MDIWSRKKRSYVMSRIREKNTTPERAVRRLLRVLGVKYQLNVKGLPGRPDVVVNGKKAVVFVHGCFWHLHRYCVDGVIPATRRSYWRRKLLGNRLRDALNTRRLQRLGWKVHRVWECEVEKHPASVLRKLQKFLC